MAWGVNSFQGAGDVYHDLPEIHIQGEGPAYDKYVWWAVGGLALFAFMVRRGRRVRR